MTFLVATAIAIVRMRCLFAVVMLSGIYSLTTAGVFIILDAVDVAFTEAAVAAGVSTMLMLGSLTLTGHRQAPARIAPILPLTVVILTGVVLLWGTSDMPRFGDPEAPVHRHVAPRYIQDSPGEIGVPNMVTSVLASYRGFDTLGETVVVFTAGIGVLALLGIGGRRGRSAKDDPDDVAKRPTDDHE
ncbi:DUF4040 domain-containing protein [Thiorhodococcus minor]|uniref:DUF4040 domain-containing protein n=1 Tax=Thiorhodococcus minor TaxID=57489 RepID=UPI001FD7484E|nr:DUF4040 domain-containing protein [Thiorhodococcus minor]